MGKLTSLEQGAENILKAWVEYQLDEYFKLEKLYGWYLGEIVWIKWMDEQ